MSPYRPRGGDLVLIVVLIGWCLMEASVRRVRAVSRRAGQMSRAVRRPRARRRRIDRAISAGDKTLSAVLATLAMIAIVHPERLWF